MEARTVPHAAAAPLSLVLQEAMALWRELEVDPGPDPLRTVHRVRRLLAAADACGQALGLPRTPEHLREQATAAGRVPPPSDAPVDRRASPAQVGRLSAREREVVRLIADGRSDRAIAEALSISRRTATTHVTSILNKLGVDNRAAAVAAAVRSGVA
jgi:DNA-binding CsgD family transcriptional regulator